MLVLSWEGVSVRGDVGDFGLIDYFDISSPTRPRRLGPTLETDGSILNGAVSDDGAIIAVAIIRPDRYHRRIIALHRVGRRLSRARVVDPTSKSDALQFAGRFLIVGAQTDITPVFVEFTTDSVELYDLEK